MLNSVFLISGPDQRCIGTGFVIDQNDDGVFVATCGHVINNCTQGVYVENYLAEIILNKYDDGLDLGVLFVKGLQQTPFLLSEESDTQKVKVIGYSRFMDKSKKETIYNIPIKTDVQIITNSFTVNTIKLSPKEPIISGYSGSPVVCEDTEKVIGIVAIQEGKETNYAIGIKHLLEVFSVKQSHLNTEKTVSSKKRLSTQLDSTKYAVVTNLFKTNLDVALKSFSTQPTIWIEPRLHTIEEESNNAVDEDTKVDIKNILNNPKSYVIKSRQQYGLTSLSHYLIYEAWTNPKPSFWLYLDSNELKPHRSEVQKLVNKKLMALNLTIEDVECVILDEFSSNLENANEILNKTSDYFENIPLIVMLTHVDNPLLNESITTPSNRNFTVLNLWALPRSDIREVINKYNERRYIGDENKILTRIVSDLDVLNIPRTPLNCITILKIYEIDFDDSPVNRTEMIKRVLFLLFNIDDIPKYKTRPDLKDTEFVLGYFCEQLLIENSVYFTREVFLSKLDNFCSASEIDLDIHVIFDVLYENNIIVSRGNRFCFRFTYWIYYFAAHRMHHSPDFAKFILENMRYASYPELIEFYTGIDRRRDDAIHTLTSDIQKTRLLVESKCAFPTSFNIYDIAQWKPSDDSVEKMHEEVTDTVLNSKLPDIIKDEFADQSYCRTRPLHQEIHTILEEYSFLRLMKGIKAGAKALRNSDYSDPIIRHALLEEILLSWEQITKILVALSPILSKDGYATLEGATFVLDGNFSGSKEEKFNQIVQLLPSNVVNWYKDDLFSKKMGSLLYKHIEKKPNSFMQHTLNLLIANKRPKNWDKHIESYIENENKNSFYLLDIYNQLRAEYKFSFASDSELKSIERLMKMTVAKHQLGMKKPSMTIIKKVSDDILPTRHIDL
ncbi:MAG: serine protease [Sulfuricurvum sp.]|uniref:S1 family peptidase n=1 Tax=Sulfuricurvum sp. TaxID=2025608 RepID=UPI002735C9AA|nr:serine protease [Sulfuricurvum sp.]MDP2851169.1 serine protease [Sulfuricurvum sp.]